jgi:cardiolipin synthase A/B
MAAASAPHTLIVEPNDGRGAILAALASATTTIDLTIYELSDAQIVAALIAAQKRSVTVRILYNWYSFDPSTQSSEITPIVQQLTSAGVACRPAPRAFEVTHEKAAVVDGTVALILSLNLVSEYFESTRDFGIISTVAAEVAEVAAVFEADWNSVAASPSEMGLVWSPTNSRSRLTALVGDAAKTLEVYNEELSDPGLLSALATAAARGVVVRVVAAVLTEDGSDNGPNENAPGIAFLNSHGVTAVCKAFPVSIPSGSVPIYIHAKAIVADFGTAAAQAFVGSENFSCVSLDDNRECGIVVSEPAILARLEATFESDWAQPSVPVASESTTLKPCPADPVSRAQARAESRQSAQIAASRADVPRR